jgi:hypothetical protein
VDDAARVPGLMRSERRLLVEHGEAEPGLPRLELTRDGQADDPGADDRDVEPGAAH